MGPFIFIALLIRISKFPAASRSGEPAASAGYVYRSPGLMVSQPFNPRAALPEKLKFMDNDYDFPPMGIIFMDVN